MIVGYLLAGMAVGPYTPPFSLVLDVARIETLSQIGLIFLMFAIGLGLSLSRLRLMGATTFIATGLGAFFVLNLTQILGVALGWTADQSLFTAAMFMVGGGILAHNIPALHHLVEGAHWSAATGFDLGLGVIAGAVCLLLWNGLQALRRKKS